MVNRSYVWVALILVTVTGTTWASEPLTGDWKQEIASAAFSPRGEHSSCIFDGNMWIIAGSTGTQRTVLNDVWKSSDGINWTLVNGSASFLGRDNFHAIPFLNQIWVIGGLSDFTVSPPVFNDVWHSTDGVTWMQTQPISPLPLRYQYSSEVFQNKLWLIGGESMDPSGQRNDVWSSTDGINWTQVRSAAEFTPRSGQSSVVFNGKLWIIGGYEQGNYKNDVWYSDDGTSWTCATVAAEFSSRYCHTSVVYNNQMLVIGGYNGSALNDVWYSSDGVHWTQLVSTTTFSPRWQHESVVLNNKVYVIGGVGAASNNDHLNDIWSFSSNNQMSVELSRFSVE